MACGLVVVGSMQNWCGDYRYWGSVSDIEQQAMVESAGEGVGTHGFGRDPGGGYGLVVGSY